MKFSDLNLLDIGNGIDIAGVIYLGKGNVFLCFFPGTASEDDGCVNLESLPMDLDEWQKFLSQTDLMETEVLAKAANGDIVKAILRKSQRQIDQHTQWRVFRRDGYACRYCGRNDVPLTVDHIILWEEGGPTTDDNLLSACKKCNKTRGNTPYEEWLNHPYYLKKIEDHPWHQAANLDVLKTLPSIQKQVVIRSR